MNPFQLLSTSSHFKSMTTPKVEQKKIVVGTQLVSIFLKKRSISILPRPDAMALAQATFELFLIQANSKFNSNFISKLSIPSKILHYKFPGGFATLTICNKKYQNSITLLHPHDNFNIHKNRIIFKKDPKTTRGRESNFSRI